MSSPLPFKRALVVLSGGQDSTTCLYLAKHQLAPEIHAVTFDYGQRHSIEIGAASVVAEMAGVESHEIISLGNGILQGTSPLVNMKKDVESYASAAVLPGGIEKTFVPMRNALFLVLAANRAVVLGCDVIVTGVSQEDYGGYPDCREEFIGAMDMVLWRGLAESVAVIPKILTPLMFKSKQATVDLALMLPGCMDALANSHTCYRGEFPPCGQCHACLLRRAGFEKAGIVDPLDDRATRFNASMQEA